MSTEGLTPTSYVVLGLVDVLAPATPYDLKRFGEASVFHFWAVPHTNVYAECQRLAASGHLDEEREAAGRRRRLYRLTERGRAALEGWRSEPSTEVFEFRDEGLLKLFFGADRAALADAQAAAHAQRLAFFEGLAADRPDMPRGMRDALEAGIALARDFVAFWEARR